MIIVKAQVFDPSTVGDLISEPRIELLVTGIDIHEPDHTNARPNDTNYMVYEYGEHLINFFDLTTDWSGQSDEERDNNGGVYLDRFNMSQATEFAYFPVTVSSNGEFWRVLYAPVGWLSVLMANHSSFRRQGIAGGKWALVLDADAGARGYLHWTLKWQQGMIPLPVGQHRPGEPVPASFVVIDADPADDEDDWTELET